MKTRSNFVKNTFQLDIHELYLFGVRSDGTMDWMRKKAKRIFGILKLQEL
jgi:hypothetical protein